MAVSTVSPYNADSGQDDQLDEYGQPKTQQQTPKPYEPVQPQQQSQSSSQEPQPPQTFSQLQQQGIARPPEPTAQTTTLQTNNSGIIQPTAYQPPAPQIGDAPPGPQDAAQMPSTTPSPQTMSWQDWINYSPNKNLTEEQKAAQFVSQGGNPAMTAVANTQTGYAPSGAGQVATYTQNPAEIAKLQEMAKTIGPQTQQAQAGALAATNAGTAQANQGFANQDYQNYLTAFKTAGGANPPSFEQWQAAQGVQNPTAYEGFPTNYDPTKPKLTPPPTTGPATYLQNGVTSSSPIPAPTGPAAVSTSGGTGGSTIPPTTGPTTGGTTGQTTAPQSGAFDLLNTLTQGAQGQGQGSDVQNATQQSTLDFLKNPNPYGAQDVKDTYNWLGGNIDDQFSLENKNLGEEMARRGLGFSTNYGGRLQDLNVGRRSAKEALATDLAHQYATTYGANRLGAINAGNQVGTQGQQNQQSWISQLMGYGQNAFGNDLATNAQNNQQQQSYQDWILKLLGMGYSPTG